MGVVCVDDKVPEEDEIAVGGAKSDDHEDGEERPRADQHLEHHADQPSRELERTNVVHNLNRRRCRKLE